MNAFPSRSMVTIPFLLAAGSPNTHTYHHENFSILPCSLSLWQIVRELPSTGIAGTWSTKNRSQSSTLRSLAVSIIIGTGRPRTIACRREGDRDSRWFYTTGDNPVMAFQLASKSSW